VSRVGDNLAALGEPEFRKLFLGQATSIAGVMFTVVAMPFAVLGLGGTATEVGLVEAAYLLPVTVFLLVGGVWADRLPRQRVMLAADFVRAALQLFTAALLIAGVARIWHLVALVVVQGIAEAFFRPAYVGLVPQVVSPGRLQQANALQSLAMSVAITAGAAASGFLVAAVGPGWAIGIDGLSYLVSAWFLLRLRPERFLGPQPPEEGPAAGEPQATPPAAGFLADLAAGWREFTSHTWLWVMVLGISLFLFFIQGPINVLGPIVAQQAYAGARTWGLSSAAIGVGQIVAGLIALSWRPRRPMLLLSAGLSFTAVPVALLALQAPVWLLYLSLAVMGLEWGLYDPFWVTCMQAEVRPEAISRVSSYDYLGSMAFYPAGLALAGPAADLVGTTTVLWASAGVALAVSVFQLSFRDVRAPHPVPWQQQERSCVGAPVD
jgi:MFS family permease